MKKVLMYVLAITAISSSASAQKLDAAQVPTAVKTAFTKQYPGVNAKWEKEKGKYEAGFKQQNGLDMSVLYESNGTMVESEVDIKVADLPAKVLNYVKEYYKGKKIKEGAKITKADGTVNYEAEVDGKDLIFDAGGEFIKEVKD
ncbi:MAG: PepSY-like domain-containing protein [Sphingobacteriales bacterium]|nr:PepSY-like domain-containing protein [Sphingobacteriales bacterium]MBI3720460.1 PepSY-like domain-containing protein [Sphingobacteriales bacterium]